MRILNKAVLKQTIQRPDRRHSIRSDSTRTGLCISDKAFEQAGRAEIAAILAKYITFEDVDHHYWIDRYWYFDNEKYEKDIESFGIDYRKPLMESMRLEQ